MSQPYFSLFLKASVGRQSPRVVPYPARSLCPGEPGLQSAAVVSMGSADHRLNLAEILSQNYGVREEREEDDTQEKQKSLEELEKSFSASQSSEMPFEELLALYGYEASDPISEQDSESNDITPNLPDMTLDKEQIAKDLLSGEEEEETQSSADDLTPSVTSHDASDLFPNQPGSNNFLADEDKEPCSSPCASSMAEDSEEDSIPSNECKKEIMVGPQYQATVPILHLNRHSEKAYENEDQLLWDPNILPERDVEEFLYRAVKRRWDELSSSSLPEGEMVKDNEQALYELVKCNFNAEEALRRLRFNVKVIRDELCAWSEEECRNFEHGFRVHGKNFHLIQANKVRTRSVGECVEYYYMWKKSERYDYFTQQTRLGRKKDFTDNDLDGGEVENTSRSRSSPPIPSATSSLDSHFGQDQIAIESTEPLSVESTACSLGSISESGQGYECSTPSETNCSFDPTEETSSGTISASCTRHTVNPSESGLFALPLAGPGLAEKQETLQSSGETITMDFTLPADINEGLPLIAGPVDLDRDPEAVVTPAQVSLSVTDFGLIGIGDVNSFLTAHQACPAPVARSEPLSQ
ncbi:PREDICTED: mesoderm induction early response protein 2 isoform X6 [Haliaeetus leucocephalus]|uniref:mesoderm induction early response protein 2 isoform X6 n=1 Tax=Haliaeetus leucocephalus TaxID=52644 RepID=UPI0005229C41|nr:PREDICTED: mesoderm induction early response protein 2 isoform X6 [Haliaeetus albicilla]XP_010561432.1 PREDICTED: mesoderm induction early response protein 2 isoform X6 [Haliaeetus leucocephalus]